MKNQVINWVKTKKIIGLIRLVFEATIYSSVPAAIFYFIFYLNHWNTITEAEANMRLRELQILFGLGATWAFQTAMASYRETMAAVKMGRKKDFMKEYYKMSSPAIDVILGFIAIWILWIKMRTVYPDEWEGVQNIFRTFYIMYIMRQLAMGLDKPSKSILYRGEITEEWLKELEEKNT